MGALLRRLDDLVYRVERLVVVTFLVVMAFVVFLDVVHRTAADPDSKIADWLIRVAVFCGADIPDGDPLRGRVQHWTPFLAGAGFVALTYFGLRTAKLRRSLSVGRAWLLALLITGCAYGAVRGLVVLVPNGLIWSQPLALIMTLWVGFLGASMCTYEGKHLRVEAVQRYLPPRLRRVTTVAAALLTAGFCLFLMWASWDYVQFHHQEWIDTERKGGMFQGVAIPRWVGFAILPVAFAIMGLRFIGGAWTAATSKDAPSVDPTAGIEGARPPRLEPGKGDAQ